MRVLAALLGLAALCLTGCLREPERLTAAEAERIAWYCEDISHGLDRDPYELVREDASAGMRAIALWALGELDDKQSVKNPQLLAVRAGRWPLLHQGMRRSIVLIEGSGMLRLDPEASKEDRELFADLVAAENSSRLALTSLLVSQGGIAADSRRGEYLVYQLRQARRELALQAGARAWQEQATEADAEAPVRPRARRAM
ncbi:MAG: hypothetical protein PF961_03310 [Planctomycetota bacterium]|jgi:hypothetical protein|nr:hypothetical protein [Planctomycetota bacterium]